MPDEELQGYRGILGHFHIQTDKVDPGPAFQWDRLVDGAREWMQREPQAVLEKPASRLMGVGH